MRGIDTAPCDDNRICASTINGVTSARPIVVQKYGGSSVASVESIRAVAEKVVATRAGGVDVVVVVSAMGKTTDSLVDLARGVTDAPAAREMDMLLSSGERISISLLAMAVQSLGVPAVSLTGPQCGIRTDDAHANARIVDVRTERLERELAAGRVVVVAGFQGESPRREVTTLGRGGSDTTAVALAAALGAQRCEIYSDVDGVYTADPRVCASASRIPQLGYAEMEALATHGAKVLNAHAVEMARRGGVVIHARATFGGPDHTVVRDEAPRARGRVVGITGRADLWRVTSERASTARTQAATEGCEVLASRRAEDGELELVVTTRDLPEAPAVLDALARAGATVEQELGSVAVVGNELGEERGVCREARRVLERASIAIVSRFASPDALTYVIRAERVDDAVRALHASLCEAGAAGGRRVA